VKRLSLITRMRVARVLTLLAMLVVAWLGGSWLSDTLSWWVALPLAFGWGWFLGKFTMSKAQPWVYRKLIFQWIREQPEEQRYLLRLRMIEIERNE
jgi:hypothetical protein